MKVGVLTCSDSLSENQKIRFQDGDLERYGTGLINGNPVNEEGEGETVKFVPLVGLYKASRVTYSGEKGNLDREVIMEITPNILTSGSVTRGSFTITIKEE